MDALLYFVGKFCQPKFTRKLEPDKSIAVCIVHYSLKQWARSVRMDGGQENATGDQLEL